MDDEISVHSKQVAKGSFWGLAGNIVFKLISFVYVIYIARMASQDDIGIFYLTLSIIALLSLISDLGFSGSIVRYVPYLNAKGEQEKSRWLLRISYILTGSAGIILSVLFWFGADIIGSIYQNPQLPDAIRLLSAFVFLQNIFRLNLAYLQGCADIKSMKLASNVQNLSKLILTFAFFQLYGASIFSLSMAFLISHILGIGASLSGLSAIFRPEKESRISKTELLAEIIPFGFMILLLQSFWVVMYSTDKILLAFLLDPSAAASIVAVYTMATLLAGVLIIFPASLGDIILPLMSGVFAKKDDAAMRSINETAQRWIIFITIPIAIVMIIFSSEMLNFFYGQEYSSGGFVMAIFTLGVLFNSFSVPVSRALAASRNVLLELKIMMAAAVLNVLLNLFFIPFIGMEGAALSSLMSFFLMAALLQYYGRKMFGFSIAENLGKLVLSGFLAFVFLWLAKPLASIGISYVAALLPDASSIVSKSIFLGFVGLLIVLSALVFIVLVLLFKCFHHEDVILMKKAMKRAMMPQALISFAERIVSYGVAMPKK